MALIKEYISDAGNVSTYWKIANYRVAKDFTQDTQRCLVSINGYKDKDFRTEKNVPNAQRTIEVPLIIDIDERPQLYALIKQEEFFSEAIDD